MEFLKNLFKRFKSKEAEAPVATEEVTPEVPVTMVDNFTATEDEMTEPETVVKEEQATNIDQAL